MRRRKVSAKKFARKHNRASKRTKSINSPAFVMRGGIRL